MMQAGPGPICGRCNDDVWKLSVRGLCDDCEARMLLEHVMADGEASLPAVKDALRAAYDQGRRSRYKDSGEPMCRCGLPLSAHPNGTTFYPVDRNDNGEDEEVVPWPF